MSYRWLLLLGFAVFTGCTPPPVKVEDTSLCPGKSSIAEAAAAVAENRSELTPLKASGRITISSIDEKGKRRTETCDVQIRFYGPEMLFLRGTAIGVEVIRLGTNKEEFWFRIKPNDDSFFYMGKREYARNCSDTGWGDPSNILDALGMINVDQAWELTKQPGSDVLSISNASHLIKKVYVNPCDYRFQKIEYFDQVGQLIFTTQLGDYNDAEGLGYPKSIKVASQRQDELTIDIKLSSVGAYLPTDKELTGKIFRMPSADGFDHVYQLGADCEFVEMSE